MANLFAILDGINSSDCADETLANLDWIIAYADACNETITSAEAARIATVGIYWRDQQTNGNGEWGRMRDDAMDALDDLEVGDTVVYTLDGAEYTAEVVRLDGALIGVITIDEHGNRSTIHEIQHSDVLGIAARA